jgi:nucleoside 2-deoxyribosyltransferase
MIIYDPIEGDAYSKKVHYHPKTCFVVTQLGEPVPKSVSRIRRVLNKSLKAREIKIIDANSAMTGRDFLDKIWSMILSVPLGIAIVTEDMPHNTWANIFYEIGFMQALGKETLVIKTVESEVPSDLVRTEYIDYSAKLKTQIDKYLDKFFEQAEHYATMAGELEQNPLLAIDYLRRAYLITGEQEYKGRILDIILDTSYIDKHSKGIIKDFL